MFDQSLVSQVKEELNSAQSVAILLPPDPTSDLVAAGLALYLTISSAGKQAQIGCGSQIKVENADLFGVDKIKNSIGNQNLIISFDFKEENLKKVDYDVDESGKFMLLIQPQPGCEAPDTSSINYSYSGASSDLVFILGVNSLEELGKIYADEKAFLDKAKIVSINQTIKPSSVASIALHVAATSTSEIVGLLLKNLDLKPTADAASNLLSVITSTTSQFGSPKVTADTFETAAFLMRHGGNLGRSPLASTSRFGAFPPNPFAPTSPMMAPTFEEDFPESEMPMPASPIPTPFPRRGNRVPNDWKKPKIFKGGHQNQ